MVVSGLRQNKYDRVDGEVIMFVPKIFSVNNGVIINMVVLSEDNKVQV